MNGKTLCYGCHRPTYKKVKKEGVTENERESKVVNCVEPLTKISLYAGTTREAKIERSSTNGQSAGNLQKQRVLRDYTRDML